MRIVYKGNYIRMTCGEIGLVQTCADPERFVRGGTNLTTFFVFFSQQYFSHVGIPPREIENNVILFDFNVPPPKFASSQ